VGVVSRFAQQRGAFLNLVETRWLVRNLDGTAKTDDHADKSIARICRRAGLPVRLFHTLRHSHVAANTNVANQNAATTAA